jgi:integrase/recombinase XerD
MPDEPSAAPSREPDAGDLAVRDSAPPAPATPQAASSPTASPPAVPTQAETDAQVLAMWLHGAAANTRRAYERDTQDFFAHATRSHATRAEAPPPEGGHASERLPLRQVTLRHLQAWALALEARGLKPATRARKLAAVKSLLTFAADIRYLAFNPGKALRLPPVPSRLARRILTEPETWRLLEAPETTRNRTLLVVAYASAARVSELARLSWEDVQPRQTEAGPAAQLTLTGKGEKARTVLLPVPAAEALAELRAEERAAGYGTAEDAVFRSRQGGHLAPSSIWRVVKKAARRAGIEKPVSPHWLRHAHVSHALDHGAPVQLVKATTGHEDLATLSRYAHARPGASSGGYLQL